MARTRCPKCGYSESDGRPHDKETYSEVCLVCAAKEAGDLRRLISEDNRRHSVKA